MDTKKWFRWLSLLIVFVMVLTDLMPVMADAFPRSPETAEVLKPALVWDRDAGVASVAPTLGPAQGLGATDARRRA